MNQETPGTTQSAPNAATKPNDTTAMQGTPEVGEKFNGYTLMVEAYAAIWLILMGWLVLLWRQQTSLTSRVAGLEAALDRAEKRSDDMAVGTRGERPEKKIEKKKDAEKG